MLVYLIAYISLYSSYVFAWNGASFNVVIQNINKRCVANFDTLLVEQQEICSMFALKDEHGNSFLSYVGKNELTAYQRNWMTMSLDNAVKGGIPLATMAPLANKYNFELQSCIRIFQRFLQKTLENEPYIDDQMYIFLYSFSNLIMREQHISGDSTGNNAIDLNANGKRKKLKVSDSENRHIKIDPSLKRNEGSNAESLDVKPSNVYRKLLHEGSYYGWT